MSEKRNKGVPNSKGSRFQALYKDTTCEEASNNNENTGVGLQVQPENTVKKDDNRITCNTFMGSQETLKEVSNPEWHNTAAN